MLRRGIVTGPFHRLSDLNPDNVRERDDHLLDESGKLNAQVQETRGFLEATRMLHGVFNDMH